MIVIGAGAIGLFCALELTRRGAIVTVIEADAPAGRPRSASAAAAGMLGPFSEALHEAAGFHRRLGDLCYDGLRCWRETAAADPALAHFVKFSGALLIAHDEADEARLHKAYRRARAANEAAEFASREAVRLDAAVFGDNVRASLSLPGEGVVAASAMLQALAARFVVLGGSLLRASAVEGIETQAGAISGVAVEKGAALKADCVVAAPGALGGETLARCFPLLGRVMPVKGILGAARLAARFSGPDVIRSPFGYAVRAGEDLLFGASMQPGRTDLDPDETVLAALEANLARLLPGASLEPPARHAGVGLRAATPDGGPIVGACGAAGGFVACGHGRNGWLLAPLTARHVADLVNGDAPAPIWSAFRPDRFG